MLISSQAVYAQNELTIRNDAYQITVSAQLTAKSAFTVTKNGQRRTVRPTVPVTRDGRL